MIREVAYIQEICSSLIPCPSGIHIYYIVNCSLHSHVWRAVTVLMK